MAFGLRRAQVHGCVETRVSGLLFVEPGVKVIHVCYYRDVLLNQQTKCTQCRVARPTDVYVFQQERAPAHRARDTVQLLQMEMPELNNSLFIASDL